LRCVSLCDNGFVFGVTVIDGVWLDCVQVCGYDCGFDCWLGVACGWWERTHTCMVFYVWTCEVTFYKSITMATDTRVAA
jgi:hypothetical protein